MAHFKINAPQKDKYTDMGMVNISASFYLEKGDEGWEKYQVEHHKLVPVFPKEGYERQTELNAEREKQMFAGDMEKREEQLTYDKWVASLPTEERDNPFCNHAIQFEHDTTEEEILWCFEWALAQTHINYLHDDLHCEKGTPAKRVNQDIGYLRRRDDYKTPDTVMLAKCVSVETKGLALKDTDFTAVETIASYSVRA
jgi:hypothetical protein